jgi:hypothetical protein
VEGAVVTVSDDGEEAKLIRLRYGEAVEEDTFSECKDDGISSDAQGE